MWSYLFGSGWVWGVLVAAGLFAGVAGTIVAMFIATRAPERSTAAADATQTAWHRYEVGDLTEWEFARFITPRPALQPRYVFPTGDATAAGDTTPTHDAAAD